MSDRPNPHRRVSTVSIGIYAPESHHPKGNPGCILFALPELHNLIVRRESVNECQKDHKCDHGELSRVQNEFVGNRRVNQGVAVARCVHQRLGRG